MEKPRKDPSHRGILGFFSSALVVEPGIKPLSGLPFAKICQKFWHGSLETTHAHLTHCSKDSNFLLLSFQAYVIMRTEFCKVRCKIVAQVEYKGDAMEFQGQLSNAPLLCVLGVVRFPNLMKIDKYIDDFQDAIRKQYPLTETAQLQTFNFNVNDESSVPSRKINHLWHFQSPDRSWGVTVESGQMLLITRQYTRFAEFAERMAFLLQAYQQVVDPGYFLATSMRYVDLVKTKPGESIADYLPEGMFLRQVNGIAGKQMDSFSASAFSTEVGNLAVRCWLNGPFNVPPDLEPVMQPLRFKIERPDNDFAIFDTDLMGLDNEAKTFDVVAIIDELDAKHKVCHKAFECIPTPYAFKVWNGN